MDEVFHRFAGVWGGAVAEVWCAPKTIAVASMPDRTTAHTGPLAQTNRGRAHRAAGDDAEDTR